MISSIFERTFKWIENLISNASPLALRLLIAGALLGLMAGASAEYFLANEQWQRQNDLGTRTAGIDTLLQGQVTQLTTQKKELEGQLEKEQYKSRTLADQLDKLRPKVPAWEAAEKSVPVLQRQIQDEDSEIAKLNRQVYALQHPPSSRRPRTLEDELKEIARDGMRVETAVYVSNRRFSLIATANEAFIGEKVESCKLSVTDTQAEPPNNVKETKALSGNQIDDLDFGGQMVRVILRSTSYGRDPPSCYFDFFVGGN